MSYSSNNNNNNSASHDKEGPNRARSPAPSEQSIPSSARLSLSNTAAAAKNSSLRSTSNFSGGRLPNPPTLIEWEGMRFLIMDAPSEDVVRVCDPTYPRETVEKKGIKLHEMLFPDGDGPPEKIISAWIDLLESKFGKKALNQKREDSIEDEKLENSPSVAVHCVAGLGRAPVLVAIAMIEAGMNPLDAISYLRERRRGAINNKQLRFLESYRRHYRVTFGPNVNRSSNSVNERCLLM